MGALPEVTVEVAFDSGWTTPAADRTWTDITDYVEVHESIGIGFGRADELATADANTLTLVLDNTDGRFTPGNTGSPYSPNVKIGRPIRVTVTPSGQSASVRFTGYLDSLPVAWTGGSDAYAKVSVTASSRISRLGAARQLRSVVEEEYLRDGPAAYYTLGEPEGATQANDSSGNGLPPAVRTGSGANPTFGSATGPGTDGLTAATFTGGKYLSGDGPGEVIRTIEAFVSISAAIPPSGALPLVVVDDDAGAYLGLYYNSAAAFVAASSSGPGASGGSITLDQTFHVALTVDGTTVTLYVDGEEVDTTTATAVTANRVSIGGHHLSTAAGTMNGVLAHVAINGEAVSSDRIADHSQAGHDGFEGEDPGARIVRYAAYAGIPEAEVDADTGTAPMAHIDTTGSTALDMMRKVEETDGGVLFDAPDGTLTYQDRAHRYKAASEFTIEADKAELGADYAPQFDLQQVVNTSTAKLADETVSAAAIDTDSVDDYGPRSRDLELHTTDVNEPHGAAWWLVNTFAEPVPRVPTLSVNLLEFSAADQAALLDLTVGSLITVSGLPSQAANDTEEYFIEGYSEAISLDAYTLTFNVSPAAPWLTTWLLGDTDRGELGTSTRLAH